MALIKIEPDSDVFFYIQLKSKVDTKFLIYVDRVETNMGPELEDKNYVMPTTGSPIKDFFAQFRVAGLNEQEEFIRNKFLLWIEYAI